MLFSNLFLFDSIFSAIDCMILMKEYVSLTTAAMKMGTIFIVCIATVAKRKNASLGNSMLNHPGHVILTLIFFFFEIFTSGRYHRDMTILKILASNSKWFRFYGILKNDKLVIGGSPGKILHFLR